MADERARSDERRAAQTGDVADRARGLVERLRAGKLARAGLELAARCGDEAARLALPGTEPFAPGLKALARELPRELRPAAAVLAVRDVLSALPGDGIAWAVLQACERQLGSSTSPSEEALVTLQLLETRLTSEADQTPWTTQGARGAIAATGRLLIDAGPRHVEPSELEDVLRSCAQARAVPDADGDDGLWGPDDERVDRTLRRDLAVWALGST